jgi:hypothetical protein
MHSNMNYYRAQNFRRITKLYGTHMKVDYFIFIHIIIYLMFYICVKCV